MLIDRPHKSRALAFFRRLTNRRSNGQKQRSEKGLNSPSPTKQYNSHDNNKENEEAVITTPPGASRTSLDDREHTTGHGLEGRSAAPNAPTSHRHASHSDVDGQSKAGTSGTVGMSTASNGGNSVFSSPNHSSRSLTTTLTTIQSQAPSVLLNQTSTGPSSSQAHPPTSGHGYATTPASAVPAYLNRNASSHVPATYRSATANNLLSDNASVLTLASSSRQPYRRDSLDEDASIRALPPRSTWGGSRESLPLSVLSQGNEPFPTSTSGALLQPQQQRFSTGTAGIGAPILSSERNSVYAGRTSTIDGSSIRSGQVGHGRSDSTAGSVMSNALPVTKEQVHDGMAHE